MRIAVMIDSLYTKVMQTLKTKKFTWLNIENPTKADVEKLSTEFQFHELNLEDMLSNVQRPKIDVQKDYLFIVLHFPRYFKDMKRMLPTEINIFLGKDYLITSSSGVLKPLNNFFKQLKDNPAELEALVEKGSAMVLYEIIDALFQYCFPILDKISERLSKTNDVMFSEKPSFIVPELAKLNQEIISFRKTMSPQRAVARDLEDKIKPFLAKGNDLYFDDITDSIEKIWNTLENLKEVSESLQRTHDSYVTYRLNEVMRILTVFSAIMLPLTVITGFYGMNVRGLPVAEHALSAEIISAAMLVLVGFMLYYFNKKNFL